MPGAHDMETNITETLILKRLRDRDGEHTKKYLHSTV